MTDLRIQAASFASILRRVLGLKDQIDARVLEGFQPGITVADLSLIEYWHTQRNGGMMTGAVCAAGAGNLSGCTVRFQVSPSGMRLAAIIRKLIISNPSAGTHSIGFGMQPTAVIPFGSVTTALSVDSRDHISDWGNLMQLNFGNALAPGFGGPGVVALGAGQHIELNDVGVILPGASFGVVGSAVNTPVTVTMLIQVKELQNGES